ncbi:MAG: nucleoside recognition protein [Desulfobacterales bacterium]|nr:nucleoside recognition protein [Desulfobacterales bacterium]
MNHGHGHSGLPWRKLALAMGATLAMVGIHHWGISPLDPGLLVKKLAWPMGRLMGFIVLGLAAGQWLEAMGYTRKLALLARPIFTFSHMGDHCSAAFTSAFISGATANAMLLDYYEEGKITKAQLFMANYLNHFPAFFLHLPTTMFIVLPLTGRAGALYFILTFAATLLRVALVMVAGRLFLPRIPLMNESGGTDLKKPTPGLAKISQRILKRLPRRIARIFIWVLPIYTLVFLMGQNGIFTTLNQALSHFMVVQFMPVESLSVVILSFAAEFTSGFAAAGALMNAGVLTVKQTVIALLAGNILAFPIRAIRHQLPRYMGIFSPKLGLQLLLSGQCFRVASLIFIGLIYYWTA